MPQNNNFFDIIKNLPQGSLTYQQKKKQAEKLAQKWQKATGLLKGLTGQSRTNFAILCENQSKRLIKEANTVGGLAGKDSWFNYAMPLIRRMWDSLNSTGFMSTQPISIPTGLVFYLDVKYGNASQNAGKNSLFQPGTSIYGFQTGPNFDLTTQIPTGGLFGNGKFGYSLNYKETGSVTATATNLGSGVSSSLVAADLQRVNYVNSVSASYAVVSGSGSFKRISVSVPTGAQPYIDSNMIQACTLTGVTGQTILPQFTQATISNNKVTAIEFITTGTGSLGSLANVKLHYPIAPITEARGTYEDTTTANQGFYGSEVLDIADLDFDIYSMQIQAISRKVKAKYTPEFVQDIGNYHAIDAEATITKICADHIATQIDLQNIALLGAAAKKSGLVQYWSARPGYQFNKTTRMFEKNADYVFSSDAHFGWFKTFGIKLTDLSNTINQRCGFGGVSFVICSPKVATIIESMPGFNVDLGPDRTSFQMGVQKVGLLENKWTIYKNPKQTDNVCIVGYKGNDQLEAGAVYAPYVPVEMTPQIFDANGSIRKILATRYASIVTRPEMYGLLVIDGLQQI